VKLIDDVQYSYVSIFHQILCMHIDTFRALRHFRAKRESTVLLLANIITNIVTVTRMLS